MPLHPLAVAYLSTCYNNFNAVYLLSAHMQTLKNGYIHKTVDYHSEANNIVYTFLRYLSTVDNSSPIYCNLPKYTNPQI